MNNKNLWEEKNSTELSKNCKSKSESETNDTISNMENGLKKNECKNIGKKWIKKCPVCNGEISYSTKQN